jgi:flagellar biosynthetic protein FliP
MRSPTTAFRVIAAAVLAVSMLFAGARRACADGVPNVTANDARANAPLGETGTARSDAKIDAVPGSSVASQLARSAPTMALFAIASLVPAAVLMVTAFVRISIVLTLLRQALGSPQIPGNQVLTALALLLTALVMQPVGENVYKHALEPYLAGRMTPAAAWDAGTGPIKDFMIDQICRTHHEDYLLKLYDYIEPESPGRAEPTEYEQLPLRIVAPAFLLSELTTALVIGFAIYLPFLVIDLVVSAVLAAMGLFMVPPTLVALPLKLILFVLADGWMLVASMLLESFGRVS